MSERQAHGFTFEEKMIKKYNITKSNNYTDKWDGYLNGIPVSIKCEKTVVNLLQFLKSNLVNSNSPYVPLAQLED